MEHPTRTIWCWSPKEIEAKREEMLAAGVDLSNVAFIRWRTKEEAADNAQLEGGAKGFGFISPHGGGDHVFVHASAISYGRFLEVGDRVTFELISSPRGPKAVGVARVKEKTNG